MAAVTATIASPLSPAQGPSLVLEAPGRAPLRLLLDGNDETVPPSRSGAVWRLFAHVGCEGGGGAVPSRGFFTPAGPMAGGARGGRAGVWRPV
jgi:hypothetical protein